MPHPSLSPWRGDAAPTLFDRLLASLGGGARAAAKSAGKRTTTQPGGESRLGLSSISSAPLHEALGTLLREVKLMPGTYVAKFVPITSASGRTGYAVFIRLDEYVKHLMDRTKEIEGRVVRQMRKRFEIEVTQIYWRYSSRARTPWDAAAREGKAGKPRSRSVGSAQASSR
ncbi:MAG TPA: hypothetical protein VFV25_04980 [Methylibium sp.]